MKDENKKHLNNLRHSCAHLLAAAVMELYPNAKRAIGPAIENGFYFDFDFGPSTHSVHSGQASSGYKPSEDDFPKIEQRMHEILKSWNGFERHGLTAEDAKKEFPDNPYKHELIDEFLKDDQKVTFYKSGNYWDLCKGGHSEYPKEALKHFKLLSIAGAYWRGSEKNPMLTRIYGTCFPAQKELDDYLEMIKEAKKRDHKKLGPQLELFIFHETAPGMPYWLPKGVFIYNELIHFWRVEHQKRNYHEIMSPLLNKKELYITSGHYDHYWEEMFTTSTKDKDEYGLKAMNCPNAMIVFGSKTRSYKDLPFRLSDTDTLHRNERSGVLNGLLRVREFRQDDAHCFVSEDLIKKEYQDIFAIVKRFYSIFNMNYSFRLSTRPEKFMGDPKIWDRAEKELEQILKESEIKYFIQEGEGAFYGPKVDILMKDSIGREWQMGTIQLDFQQPRNFKLVYTDKDGKEKTPVAVHRVIYGSLERFIGILIEHFQGAFPVWLAPLQIAILPIADRHREYAQKIVDEFKSHSIRAELDDRQETLQSKIRLHTLQKVPFMGIIGDREVQSEKNKTQNTALISVRTREGKDLGQMEVSAFIQQLKEEIDKKV